MILPPPNVTGELHVGHALTVAIEDAIVRRKRMLGFDTVWIPGLDHAGIATQAVVERRLKATSGETRQELGREAFEQRVWQWRQEYGDRIVGQLRSTGASLDWSREFFSLDDTRSAAVVDAFVQLYNDGLIYRDNRLVNWCCSLQTAISDIEVEHEELIQRTKLTAPNGHTTTFGVIYDVAYPLDDTNSDVELIVSTTRPETMYADEALAIHPDDPRYTHLHNKHVVHPLTGRRLPILLDDELVHMEFGTGVVKVTPAHDQNDYECGKRHDLPVNS